MNRDTLEMMNRLARYVPNMDDALALRRISMALHRWHELECGTEYGCIERDETTGKPFWLNARTGRRSYAVADRETGALKRLEKIMAKYPELGAYVQTDPRGAALYIYRKERLADYYPTDIAACYSSIGCAVYK